MQHIEELEEKIRGLECTDRVLAEQCKTWAKEYKILENQLREAKEKVKIIMRGHTSNCKCMSSCNCGYDEACKDE